ncbi:MAG: TlpA disulfide reductase family protein, partial [Pirellulaceae bacterium]
AKLQKLAEKDPVAAGELVALVKQLIDSRADANVTMGLANTISERLGQYDRPVERAQLLSLVGQTYRGHSDEYVAHVAAEFLTQVKIIESGLDDNLKKLIVGEPGAAQQVLASMQAVLRTEKPGESLFRSMFQTAEYLEIANEFAVEQQILGLMEAAFAAHPEQQLADTAKQIIADSRLRMAMVGRPVGFAVQSEKGEAIDWSAYRGKTVLVNFWVTSSGESMQELNNLKRTHAAYQGRGFDVVSVNLNEQRAELDKYLALNTVPWTMAVALPVKDAAPIDAPVKLREQWGISMLPFNVLVDREGIVVALHARGSDLDKKLEQLYGPPASSPVGAFIPAAPAPGAVPSPGDGAAAEAVSNDDLSMGPVYFTALLAEETEEAGEEEKPAAEVNPYRAPPGISDSKLLQYLLDMADKPRVIQERPGFAAAVLEASDRLLAMDTKPNYKRLAVLSKLRTLHRLASFGDKQADEQLVTFVEALKDNTDAKVAVELKFLKLEREAIDCEKLPVEQIPDLLARLKEFFAAEKSLNDVHLRMASNTIRAVNRLENDDEREKHFAEFGKLFAASKDQQLSIYGQKLAKPVAESQSELVGKELELTGLTALGAEFNWKSYRGKVVIVDFWATWCGPCIKALPSVKELHARL